MRWIWRGAIALVGLVGGLLVINHWIERSTIRNFYANRPLLKAMYDAAMTDSGPRSSNAKAQAVLDASLPVGTPRAEAMQRLAADGVSCRPAPQEQRSLACGIPGAPMVVFRWHLDLGFDEEDRLQRTRVLILK